MNTWLLQKKFFSTQNEQKRTMTGYAMAVGNVTGGERLGEPNTQVSVHVSIRSSARVHSNLMTDPVLLYISP